MKLACCHVLIVQMAVLERDELEPAIAMHKSVAEKDTLRSFSYVSKHVITCVQLFQCILHNCARVFAAFEFERRCVLSLEISFSLFSSDWPYLWPKIGDTNC